MQYLPPDTIVVLSSLPDEIREKALTAAGYKPEEWLPRNPEVSNREMASAIICSIEWISTPEGYDFWEDWYYKIIG